MAGHLTSQAQATLVGRKLQQAALERGIGSCRFTEEEATLALCGLMDL